MWKDGKRCVSIYQKLLLRGSVFYMKEGTGADSIEAALAK
jgi:hypothetical protein